MNYNTFIKYVDKSWRLELSVVLCGCGPGMTFAKKDTEYRR